MMVTFSRREFVTIMGIAAGGGALAYAPDIALKAFETAWGKDWVEVPQGPERWITSVCGQCPGGCGIRVRMIGERPIKIEGNPFHPVNRGKLCPKGQTGLLALNDPDRLAGPLKRVGDRGAGRWQEITWDDAVKIVADRLKEMRSKNVAHSLAVMIGEGDSLTSMLFGRFLHQFGSPNLIEVPTGLDYGCSDAFALMQGIRDGIVYDLEMANYVIAFDTDLLQSFRSPVQMMNAFGYTRRGKSVRGKIVQVESRCSTTAAKADEWIPIKPGTEGAFALGMAHFIIKEGLYNKEFVEKHTFGFEDWRDSSGAVQQGYKNLVLQNYSPAVVSEITGVPLDSLLRAAKEFATISPALAIGPRGDIYQQMAIHALNALVGNIDKPGGLLTVKRQLTLDLPAPERGEIARRGSRMQPLAAGDNGKFPLAVNSLLCFAERVNQGKPYNVAALLVHHTNPCYSHRHVKGLVQAIEKTPFVVSFSPYMDETALLADLVLPDHTALEKWHCSVTATLQGFPVIGIGSPVVAAAGKTRDTGDVVMEIARAVGGPVGKAFPWKDTHDVLRDVMKKVYALNAGDLFAPELDEALLRELVRRGWRPPGYQNFDDFWKGAQEKGGWWDPAYSYEEWTQVFRTPSKKFEFYSQILKNHVEKSGASLWNNRQALRDAGVEAQGDRLFLPHWERHADAISGSENGYPLRVKMFQPLVLAGLLHANDPFLQDAASYSAKEKWTSWVEINPHTAKKFGIAEGNWVWVESPSAKLKCRAKVTHGTVPDVVNVPLGRGHWASGRWAKGIGEDAGRLVRHYSEPFTGEALISETRVKVYLA